MHHCQHLEDNEFRLLSSVKTGDFFDYRLEVHSLGESPPYTALSYTWGKAPYQSERPESERYFIMLNGETFEKQQNLHDYLKIHWEHSADLDTHKHIWIDAVCINQTDDAEKSKQVAQMRKIYETSAGVFAWLGVSENDTLIANTVQLINRLDLDARQATDPAIYWKEIVNSLEYWAYPIDGIEWVNVAWQGFAEICGRSYWRRLWIYQEITTPGNSLIGCGVHAFNTDAFLVAERVLHLNKLNIITANKAATLMNLRTPTKIGAARTLQAAVGKLRLNVLMQDTRSLEGSDPRDKVFAPLALLGTGIALGQSFSSEDDRRQIDYSLNLRELYTRFAKLLLTDQNSRGDLKVLGLARMPFRGPLAAPSIPQDLEQLPPWVPDWRQRNSTSFFSRDTVFIELSNPLYEPCPGTQSDTSFVGAELELTARVARGLKPPILTTVCPEPPFGKEEGYLNYSWEWYNVMKEDQTPDVEEAIRETLVADRMAVPGLTPFARGGLVDWGGSTINTEDLRFCMAATIGDTCCGNRLARLTGGQMAMLPGATTIDDQIAAFHCGRSLYVIRPVPDRIDDAFIFVGECYVGALMDGAFVVLCNDSGDEARRIRLV